MLNSVGLQGPGIEHWIEHGLPELRALGARVFASLWGRTVEDFAVAAKMLQPAVADLVGVEVNVSCPNVEDRARMFAHSTDEHRLPSCAQCWTRELGLPVFAKLSPNTFEIVDIAGAALDAGATGLTLVNTLLGYGIDATNAATASRRGRRRALGSAAQACRAPRGARRRCRAPGHTDHRHRRHDDGEDVVEMLLAGASAVGVGTVTFREPRAMLRIRAELETWCGAHGISRVADLTGALQDPST